MLKYNKYQFKALGTRCELRVVASRHAGDAFACKAYDWLENFERLYSRFKANSLVSHLNAQAGKSAVRPEGEFIALLEACEKAHTVSDGRFDATAAPLYHFWKHADVNSPTFKKDFDQVRRLVGWHLLEWDAKSVFLPKTDMSLDLGGVGKEYAVDRLAELAHTAGLDSFHINLGGDTFSYGEGPEGNGWPVILRGTCRGITINDAALASSGCGQRIIEGRHKKHAHLINAKTGFPVPGAIQMASVQAESCLQAGMHSTWLALSDSVEDAVAEAAANPLPALLQSREAGIVFDSLSTAFVIVSPSAGSPRRAPFRRAGHLGRLALCS